MDGSLEGKHLRALGARLRLPSQRLSWILCCMGSFGEASREVRLPSEEDRIGIRILPRLHPTQHTAISPYPSSGGEAKGGQQGPHLGHPSSARGSGHHRPWIRPKQSWQPLAIWQVQQRGPVWMVPSFGPCKLRWATCSGFERLLSSQGPCGMPLSRRCKWPSVRNQLMEIVPSLLWNWRGLNPFVEFVSLGWADTPTVLEIQWPQQRHLLELEHHSRMREVGTGSPNARKLKLSSILDPTLDAEVQIMCTTEITNCYEEYKKRFGDYPTPESDVSPDQLSALKQVLESGSVPFADFSVFGPFGTRRLRKQTFMSYQLNVATGEWSKRELPGPADFHSWYQDWKCYRTGMLLLEACQAEHLDAYSEFIRGQVG